MAVAILSAAFTALTVIGIFSQDFDFAVGAMVMLVVVIAASSYFVIQDSDPEPKAKKRIGDIHIGGELRPEFATQYGRSVRVKNGKLFPENSDYLVLDFADIIKKDGEHQ